MSRTVKAHILLVLVTLVWGATFVEIKDALRDISPLLFNAVRMSLAGLVLLAIYFGHLKSASRAGIGAGILVGCFLWLGYSFQTTGLRLTTPAKSAFLTGLAVVLVPVLLAVFWKKKSTAWQIAGVLLAFIGLYLLTVPSGSSEFGNWRSINVGDMLTILCAIAFGFHIILLGRATAQYPFEVLAVIQTLTAAIIMFTAAPFVESIHAAWSARVLWTILITGLLGTAAAFTIQAWAQQFISPTNTALIFALEPVFAWITSYLVVGERLGWRGAVGASLILAGLLSSELLGRSRIPAETQAGSSPAG